MKLLEQQNREENNRLNKAIEELMEEAAAKTQKEVEALKKIYNANLEKLINELSLLESDQNSKDAQLEKAIRAKKSLEQELEKVKKNINHIISNLQLISLHENNNFNC
jgi:hypothetical protein